MITAPSYGPFSSIFLVTIITCGCNQTRTVFFTISSEVPGTNCLASFDLKILGPLPSQISCGIDLPCINISVGFFSTCHTRGQNFDHCTVRLVALGVHILFFVGRSVFDTPVTLSST
ncbi:hypothetical protein SCLCIDRAFT_985743 [Scleroderma citrinum Foug A]|uniref:Uncharacterized protein n=1 Tax=Scleroderma citrinum Foug A TaxID=1036808 RepID=A0A0C3DU68_9AGAM|nr:hypothetical protein SCLCIDRAFT_985743 [Scleroderma citrinum Foug A]